MNIALIFVIAALVVFILAIFGIPSRLNLVALGLALLTCARLCGAITLLLVACCLSGCSYDDVESFGRAANSAAYGYYGDRFQREHPVVVQPVQAVVY